MDIIYKEKIFSKWTWLLAAITVSLLFALVYQILVKPIGTHPAPNWFFLLMFLLFLGITINFSTLNIRITSHSIDVSYGVFKHTIPWKDIENCYLDEASIINYGGWGIRIGVVKGKCRLVYNVLGGYRVVLSLKEGRFKEFKEFVFSTNNPEKVIEIAKQKIGEIK